MGGCRIAFTPSPPGGQLKTVVHPTSYQGLPAQGFLEEGNGQLALRLQGGLVQLLKQLE